MKSKIKIIAAMIFLIPALARAESISYTWERLADGIDYTTYQFPIDNESNSAIHAFKIDPKKFRIDVIMAENEKEGATAEALAKQARAYIAINGSFFTPEHESIGLIIKDWRELKPIHQTSWWGIFTMRGDSPAIYSPKDFKNVKDARMALQVGPRLAIAGTIPRLKESVAARSAVGITKDGKVIIAITQGPGISMRELAERMSGSKPEGGLECPDALALDGGGSSQIYANVRKFKLSLQGLSRVTNGLAVLPK